MSRIIMLMTVTLLAGVLLAQPPISPPNYAVTSVDLATGSSSNQYADLASPTVVTLGDDALSATISPMGFKFYYFGTVFDSFKIGNNGYITMGSAGSIASPTPNHGGSPGGLIIAPLWCDLLVAASTTTGSVGYELSNNILTIEWKDIYQRYSGPTLQTPAVRMQIKLDMVSSKIYFRYGTPNAFQSFGATTGNAEACAISSSSGYVPSTVIVGESQGGVDSNGAVTSYPANWETTFSPNEFAPIILSDGPIAATVGQAYTYDIVATGNSAPSLSATTLPAWLSLSGNTLSGTPGTSDVGSHSVTIVATSVYGADSESYSIIVSTSASAPIITSSAPATALVGSAYNYQIVASGSPAPTFGATGLPMWLSISGDTISGTPSAGDIGTTGTITVTATNTGGNDTQQFAITVSTNATSPAITSSPVLNVIVGDTYTYSILATGNPNPSITAAGLPSWLILTGSTLSGVPGSGDIGTTGTITVTATNSQGSDIQNFVIIVSPPAPPVIIGGGSGGGGCVGTDSSKILLLALLSLLVVVGVLRHRQRA